MPGPCSGKSLISILVTDYIQKRRGQAHLFSFEYNLLPNLLSNFNYYMDSATVAGQQEKLSQVRFIYILDSTNSSSFTF